MAMHHSLASLATFVVAFVCAVGALPIGWYGSSYYPMTSLGAPYLGQYSYLHHHPFPSVNLYNPYQRFLHLLRPDRTPTNIQDIPSTLVSDKGTNWVLTIMKWPGWDTVITDDKAKKKWKKLIGTLSNYTDINNPEWSKQLRQWIEKQDDVVDLFVKVSKLMAKSPQWEKNIKVWLNFTSISADYVDSFKRWLKSILAVPKPKPSENIPGGPITPFPGFPSSPWQPPIIPWRGVDPAAPGVGDQQGSGMVDPGLFQPGQRPSGPMGLPPFFYPQPCTGFQCPSSPSTPPTSNNPDFPQPDIPNFPQPPNPNIPQPPIPGFPQPPFPNFPQPSNPNIPQPSNPDIPQPPNPDFPQPPFPNFPQPPNPNIPQLPFPNFPQPSIPNIPQPPNPDSPQPSNPNIPQNPIPNFPQPPFPNFPQTPFPNFPENPMPNLPQSPNPDNPQPSIPNFPQPSIPNFPFPNFPQSPLQNFPGFPGELPQFQPPQDPMLSNPFLNGGGFNENPFSDGGMGIELPTFNNILQRDPLTATKNQTQNPIGTMPDTQVKDCPQCEEISIILDLRRSNITFCKTVLTSPRQSLKNLLILASFENECFNLTTKVRDSRLWGPKGEYIFSLNGLSETIFNYWIAYQLDGTQDTELNTFKPENGDHIIIDYTNWKTIINKIAIPK